MAELVVVTRGLEKRFGHTLAIAGVDLVVPQGSVFGFLGPNGAGKTTTLRMLIGLIKASAGSVSVFGRDGWRERRAIQQMVGYLPGDVRLYNDATGLENLDFLAHLHTLPPVRRTQMVERFEMPQAVLARKARTYSRGTLQKLGLIACLQHDAPLLVLDEPTEGLDPLMQAVFAEFLEEERDSGKTVLLSSHALSEVERSCDVVAIIREGRLLF
ncbi:MAG TPA: ABC transporter ATP-binding protein, partial [Acidimicrobiia bacterium]|nr:ABC transporter ATP-binding protein [Acidimicrobiia bacterium]